MTLPRWRAVSASGSATGINDIAEATGNISLPAQPVDATNQAIGQGDLLVTPLQVARFVAAIGNGGTLYRPQIVEKILPVSGAPIREFKPEVSGTLPLRPDNLAAIQEAMTMVINNPRGTANFRLRGLTFKSAGKTGTAQSGSGEPHAWFIGYTQVEADTTCPISPLPSSLRTRARARTSPHPSSGLWSKPTTTAPGRRAPGTPLISVSRPTRRRNSAAARRNESLRTDFSVSTQDAVAAEGLIIQAQSGFFTVETPQGAIVCQLRGKLKQGRATRRPGCPRRSCPSAGPAGWIRCH